jgi:hypothetical protein
MSGPLTWRDLALFASVWTLFVAAGYTLAEAVHNWWRGRK